MQNLWLFTVELVVIRVRRISLGTDAPNLLDCQLDRDPMFKGKFYTLNIQFELSLSPSQPLTSIMLLKTCNMREMLNSHVLLFAKSAPIWHMELVFVLADGHPCQVGIRLELCGGPTETSVVWVNRTSELLHNVQQSV